MKSANKPDGSLFILAELLLGIIISIIFLRFVWNNDYDEFLGNSLYEQITRIYGWLSLIFFFSVFLVGIVGAIVLKRSNKIGRAILYSIFFWILSLFAASFLAQVGAIPSLYVMLVGIVVGFDIGLAHNSQTETNDSDGKDFY